MIARLALPLGLSMLFSWGVALVALAEVAGSLTIAGNGPELTTIDPLARAFEKANPRAYLDVVWDANSKPIEMVKSGQAHIAVTGTEAPGLSAVPIAWDGIGVLVHLSNFTKDITKQQVADIFSGKITLWSDVGGPETKILVIDRPRNQNIRDAFESQLGMTGKITAAAKVIGSDEQVVTTVVGTLPPCLRSPTSPSTRDCPSSLAASPSDSCLSTRSSRRALPSKTVAIHSDAPFFSCPRRSRIPYPKHSPNSSSLRPVNNSLPRRMFRSR